MTRSTVIAVMVLYLGLYVLILAGVYQSAGGWVALMGGLLIILLEAHAFILYRINKVLVAQRDLNQSLFLKWLKCEGKGGDHG